MQCSFSISKHHQIVFDQIGSENAIGANQIFQFDFSRSTICQTKSIARFQIDRYNAVGIFGQIWVENFLWNIIVV